MRATDHPAMKLAPRLVVVSLVTLLLPWAGCQYLGEMQTALRDSQVSAIQATSNAVAGLLESRPGWFDTDLRRLSNPVMAPAVYANALRQTPALDGFVEDWGISASDFKHIDDAAGGTGRIDYVAGETPGFLWLFIRVRDDQPVFGTPAQSDSIRIRLGSEMVGFRDLIFAPQAPGPLSATGVGWHPDGRITAYWQATSSGYNFELRMPLTIVGERIGFLVTDRDAAVVMSPPIGTMRDAAGEPGWLIRQHRNIDELLSRMLRPGLRLRVVDAQGWVLGSSGGTGFEQRRGISRLFIRRLIRNPTDRQGLHEPQPLARGGSFARAGELPGFLHRTEPGLLTFEDAPTGDVIVTATRPLELSGGQNLTLLAEQNAEAVLSVADQAAIKLIGFSFAIMIGIALLLVGFATWLSIRIRRLSRAAAQALGQSGALSVQLPEADSGDEIGDLSRDFSRLLRRVRDYNLYLRSLSGKLTHELRTPMTVVGTSLENMAEDPSGTQSATYLQRARDGIERLRKMVNALGAATRMEESIASADHARFDLSALISELGAAYQATHPTLDVRTEIDASECWVEGSADLMAQMLDKLFQNARDFCPPDGIITLGLSLEASCYAISVLNTGSLLPDQAHDRLFDSLVSSRDKDDDQPHLGLGLYIVRLVAEHHGGRVAARNLPDGSGVQFKVLLPAND
ncbi:MAG: ATP-binding protein [Gammaproteobacteria bacterium]